MSYLILSVFLLCANLQYTYQNKEVKLLDSSQFYNWQRCNNDNKLTILTDNNYCWLRASKEFNGIIYSPIFTGKWDNYQLEFDVKKIYGDDVFCAITFPVGTIHQQVALILGGWGGDTCGISCIDGKHAIDNETLFRKKFTPNQWYHIKIQITNTKLILWVDDQCHINFLYNDRHLSLRHEVRKFSHTFSISSSNTSAELKNLIYKRLN
jgi:hypothetical protein